MWRKATTARFIELYKQQPLLWNKNHDMYGDMEAREVAFLEIRDGLLNRLPNVTVSELKRKLHGLRTQLLKEKHDMKNHLREKPLLWCYDLLHFMRGEPEKDNSEILRMVQLKDDEELERPDWTKQDVIKLMDSYTKYPALWDPRHENFFNPQERKKHYAAVRKALDTDLSIIDIKKKIKSLRTQYNCEKRAKHLAKKMQKPWKSKFWAYDKLKLWDPSYIAKNQGNESHENSSTGDCESNDDDDQEMDEVNNQSSDATDEKSPWTHSEIFQLIKAYKNLPALWNREHPYFSKKSQRQYYYNQLWKATNRKHNIQTIRRKINRLRSQFTSANREIQLAHQRGEVPKKQFWTYQHLKFLDPKYNEKKEDGEFMTIEAEEEAEGSSRSCMNEDRDEEKEEHDETVDDENFDNCAKRAWSKAEIRTLIQLYKQFDGLWDQKHADFFSPPERLKYLKAITKAFGNKFDVSEIKKKLRVLRTQYTCARRYKKIAESAGIQTMKEFWAYDLLDFLEPVCTFSRQIVFEKNIDAHQTTNVCENDGSFEAKDIDATDPENENESLLEVDPFEAPLLQNECETRNDTESQFKKQRFSWLGEKLVDTLNTMQDEFVICEAVHKVEEIITAVKNENGATFTADQLLNIQMPEVINEVTTNQFGVSLVFDAEHSNFSELMAAIAQLPALKLIKLTGKNLQNAILR